MELPRLGEAQMLAFFSVSARMGISRFCTSLREHLMEKAQLLLRQLRDSIFGQYPIRSVSQGWL